MNEDDYQPVQLWECPKCWTVSEGPLDAVAPRPSRRKVRICPSCLEEV